MEALLVAELPKDPQGWQFEPKWDGFRCLAFRAGPEVEIKAKSGKSLSRFFPEVVANLCALPHPTFVLDGELVVAVDRQLGGSRSDARHARLTQSQAVAEPPPGIAGWRGRQTPRPALSSGRARHVEDQAPAYSRLRGGWLSLRKQPPPSRLAPPVAGPILGLAGFDPRICR